MLRRLAPHKVGLVASLAGVAALLALEFGSIAAFRIATGEPVTLSQALAPAQRALLLALWAACLASSLFGARSRAVALVRGLASGLTILALAWLSGSAAQALLASEGALARYSIGAGVWLSSFFAFAMVVASRREAGQGTAASYLVSALVPAGLVAVLASGHLSQLGVVVEYRNVAGEFWIWVGQHIVYSAVAMVIALVIGVTLGVVAHRQPRYAGPVFTATSVFQTIPGLAMIGILAVPLSMLAENVPAVRSLGIGVLGWAPVVIALTLYALLAIVRNTHAGLESVPGAIVDAGRGMGLSDRQVLQRVELPLATPVVFSGARTATQQTIGNATLGVFVAAGTLGRPIFGGVSQTANDLVLLGSIALVILALTVDGSMRVVQRLLTPRHLGGGG